MRTTPERLSQEYRARGAWSDRRVGDLYAESAARDPDRVALVDPPNRAALDGAAPRRLTWRELAALVDATMVALADAGVRRDDVLVTQLPNVAEYPAIYLACARLGVVVSPVPMQFRRAELEPICRLTNARAILTVAKLKDAEPARLATEVAGSPTVLVLGSDAPAGTRAFAPHAGNASTAARAAELERAANVDADDILTICWTSGTEGVPKGVPRSHNHWISGSVAHYDGAQIRPGDKLLNPFPLVNMAAIGGCFMSWLRAAGTLILHHPFELPVYLQQIATERPEYAIAPPAVLMLLLQNEALLKGVDLSCLRCVGSGSAPLPPVMIKSYKEKYGIEIVNNFGSNEGVALCSGPTETADPEQRAVLFPRFGRADVHWPQRISKYIETRVIDVDTNGEIVEAARPGELQIRGPVVFDGYFAAPEINAKSFTADGWFRTGDLFEIDHTGRFYRFVGRLKQLIVRGGMKISPDELDAVLAEHPDVAEAAAVGYPDDALGERICAVIVPKPGRTVTVEQLQQHFRARGLAVFKWPERVCLVERLPRNPVGKVVRGDVQRIAAHAAATAPA
jgi:acyl-CoA synthetase (AMP-forming)/AMP-acid ligase II